MNDVGLLMKEYAFNKICKAQGPPFHLIIKQ